MTTTDTTTTETTTTDTTTTETTTKTTTKMIPLPAITALNRVISKSASGNGTLTSVLPRATVFPATGNTTNFQSGNSSTGSAAANSTAAPSYLPSIPSVVVSPHANTTTNGSSVAPTASTGGAVVMPTSSPKGNRSSTLVVPTRKPPVTAEGSTAPRQTPADAPGSSSRPNPSKAAALRPTTVQLLLRVPLSFRILNRSFNETLRDPASKDYQRLQRTVLTMVSPSSAHGPPGRATTSQSVLGSSCLPPGLPKDVPQAPALPTASAAPAGAEMGRGGGREGGVPRRWPSPPRFVPVRTRLWLRELCGPADLQGMQRAAFQVSGPAALAAAARPGCAMQSPVWGGDAGADASSCGQPRLGGGTVHPRVWARQRHRHQRRR